MASPKSNYCDAGTQTKWKGLTRGATVRPEALFSPPADTPTPPDDMMITEKPQFLLQVENIAAISPGEPSPEEEQSLSRTMSLLERRRNPSGLVAHIDLPANVLPDDELSVLDDQVPAKRRSMPVASSMADELAVLDDEILPSPPPTHAALTPLPAINRLHAGHTPPIPNLSMLSTVDDESRSATPQLDISLTGPLSLPSDPTQGAEDTIGLEALDDVLARIAKQQERFSPQDAQESHQASGSSPTRATHNGRSASRKGSTTSRRPSDHIKPVDGVILKSPPLNFGAPIGQM
ncbi:hypothetical protein P153DRAFT_434007 [Dothidotthia symphoricarpi CBS 119687]|uniref:Uncharacterized protein n=1 Tax=Dothidotthia symphoricarpi CBS 119687 TaxID=1392245 RepID=A0A6A6A4X7_9PLEO|nr:uncharacterized protein P153DRAFT_434007 [Dothidotthia symphoricarpi CBS 119687]KAF2126225.1 hypothetical protein P153DRAFT_434007 [Dothidotthia symphoricarpi CBS 119687]